MRPQDIQHVTQKANLEFHDNRVAQISEILKANPPGTLHTPAEQYPVIRPVLEYFRDAIVGQSDWRDALTDFMSVCDAGLESEEDDDATKPKTNVRKRAAKA
jgi:hypothetical protein